MFASKHLDIVLGCDVHIVNVPTPAGLVPTPLPHPYIGRVFDISDYNIPILGTNQVLTNQLLSGAITGMAMQKIGETAVGKKIGEFLTKHNLKIHGGCTVFINGLRRNKATTDGIVGVPHFPIGGVSFQKKIGNDGETFTGSSTVLADGEPLSRFGEISLSCHCIGGSLPTSVVIAIPTGPLVLVGGPPTVNALRAIMVGCMAGLGMLRFLTSKIQALKDLQKKVVNALEKKNATLARLADKGFCFFTGHPVDVASGYVLTNTDDFSLPGPIPLEWSRDWYSTSINYCGPLGHGWHHKYDMVLSLDDTKEIAGVRLYDGRPVFFFVPEIGEESFNKPERLSLRRDENGYYLYDYKDQLYYRFSATPFKKQDVHPLTSIENTAGHSIQFRYNKQEVLSGITDSAGRELTVHSNEKGLITSIEAPHPENEGDRFTIVSYEYDDNDNLINANDALSHPLTYSYKGHLLVQETFRTGLSFYFEYDGTDHEANCIHTWGDGGIYDHKLTYHKKEKYTEVENSLGHVTTYHYNDVGMVYKIIDPLGNVSLKQFSPDNELLADINEMGETTRYVYDDFGNTVVTIQPDGTTEKMEYNEHGSLVGAIDAMGGKWQWEYNEQDQLIKRTDPLGNETHYEYTDGLLTNIVNPADGATAIAYDPHKNLSRIITIDGHAYTWKHDKLGNTTESLDPKGNKNAWKYDLKQQCTLIKEADGNERTLLYDPEGNITRVTDKQYDVQFEYGGFNKLYSRIENNTQVRFKYNTEEDLTAIVNEHGSIYKFDLDENGNVEFEYGFDGIKRHYKRDAASRVKTVMRASGIETDFEYDLNGRVTKVSHSTNEEETFTYREDGLLTSAINHDHTVQLEYDILGRLTKEVCGEHEVLSEYDILGQRTKVSSSLGASIETSYSNMGDVMEVASTSSSAPWKASYRRDIFGLEMERTLPGNVQSQWKRDRLGRPVGYKVMAGQKAQISKQYHWQINNRLSKIIDEFAGTTTFQHDAVGNLAGASYGDGTQELRMPDQVGNLFKAKDQKDRKYGPAGQLLESNGTTFSYDEEGNLTEKRHKNGKVWKYQWNATGMLTKVERPDGQIVTFTYDALGRRITKTFQGKTTHWVWDGNVMLHEWTEAYKRQPKPQMAVVGEEDHHEEELMSSEAANAPPKDLVTWVFESNTFSPIAKLCKDEQYSIVTDYLGTPTGMFSSQGEKVWSADTSIYGKLRNFIGSSLTECPFRYPGQYEDEETGLYYNRFRYYDADEGLYVSQDPIRLEGGLAIYSFVSDVNWWIDPLGLSCIKTKKWIDSEGRTQIVIHFPSKKKAKEAAINNGGLFQTKGKTKTKGEKHNKGGRHFHDIHHNNPKKPNIHYEY